VGLNPLVYEFRLDGFISIHDRKTKKSRIVAAGSKPITVRVTVGG
jgi:hypothetical protein